MQVRPGPPPLGRGIVPSASFARVVQGLVSIAHEMNKETEGVFAGRLLLGGCGRGGLVVLQLRGHVEQTVDNVSAAVLVLKVARIRWVVAGRVDVVEDACPSWYWIVFGIKIKTC